MQNSENVLIDICGSREIDWQGKKKKSRELAEIYRLLSECNRGVDDERAEFWFKNYKKVKDCGSLLLFGKKKGSSNSSKKLIYANFCKNRFCPTCMWRRSRKFGYQLTKTLEKSLELYPNSKFIFLTLTEKNIKADNLYQAIKNINASYSRLFHYKRLVDNVFLGTVRATECTFNSKSRDFNLHIHVLIQVKNNYFDKNHDYYITQSEWQSLWKKADRLDYDPVINVKVVEDKNEYKKHNNKRKISLIGAVSEVAKYEVKSYEFINLENKKLSMWLLDIYSSAFKGVRGLGLSGILRKIKLELFSKNDEDDLVYADNSNSDLKGDEIVFIQYEWDYQVGDYLEVTPSECLIDFVTSRRRRYFT